MNDPTVVRATDAYVRLIIRRPHAYHFLNETFANEGGIASATPAGCVTEGGTVLPLPGLYIVDYEGNFVDSTTIGKVEEVVEMLKGFGAQTSTSKVDPESADNVSIRVSGFMEAEGIT